MIDSKIKSSIISDKRTGAYTLNELAARHNVSPSFVSHLLKRVGMTDARHHSTRCNRGHANVYLRADEIKYLTLIVGAKYSPINESILRKLHHADEMIDNERS